MSALAVEQSRRRAMLPLAFAGVFLVGLAMWMFGGDIMSHAQRLQAAHVPLAYQVDGGRVIEGGYLHESGNQGMKLSFSEGTEVALMPGARGRLRSIDTMGARVAIESGTAQFRVTPRRDARWLVDVGPFLVTVTGTDFSVSWDVTSERFELKLRHGSVTVSGPVSGRDIALREGQRLVVNLPKSETLITDESPEVSKVTSEPVSWTTPSASAAAEQLVRETPTAARLPVPEASNPSRVTPRTRWAEAVAAADWDRILRDAETAGVQSTLERATSDDLFALADAARYKRQLNLARDTLLAQRRRFPGSPRSLDAAYLLGRVEESIPGHDAKALIWYDEYLDRAPSGTYASEALGRKMIMAGKLSGGTQVRPLAEEYLRRFPQGTYAGSAKALLRAP